MGTSNYTLFNNLTTKVPYHKYLKFLFHPLHCTHIFSCDFRHIADYIDFPQQGYDILIFISFLFDFLY